MDFLRYAMMSMCGSQKKCWNACMCVSSHLLHVHACVSAAICYACVFSSHLLHAMFQQSFAMHVCQQSSAICVPCRSSHLLHAMFQQSSALHIMFQQSSAIEVSMICFLAQFC